MKYRPFPTAALPPPLCDIVKEAATALGCDEGFIAPLVLAVVAGCIGNRRSIRLKRGWYEVAVLWAATVGDSGTLKSPALDAAARALHDAQERRLEGGGERVVISDATVEAVAVILADNPGGVALVMDELAAWLSSFTRYKTKGSDLAHWLMMSNAGPLVVDRKTGEQKRLFVRRAAVSVCGTIQPGVLAKAMTSDLLDAGLLARLLLSMPPRPVKVWSDLEVDPRTSRRYGELLERLLGLGFADERKAPEVLTLSPAAKDAWVTFYNAWGQEQHQSEGELAAALSKLEGVAARLALVHHVVRHVGAGIDDRVPVARESVEAGVTLVRWFANEAFRIYGTLKESTEARDRRKLVEWVTAQGGRVSVRQLQRANSRRWPSAEDAEADLNGLVQAGEGKWVEVPAPRAGGWPQRWFVLTRPTHDTSDTRQAGSAPAGPGRPGGRADTRLPTPRISREKGQVSEESCVGRGKRPGANGEAQLPQVSGASVGREESLHPI